jgi:RNAse (barnase) inhibitor barstar
MSEVIYTIDGNDFENLTELSQVFSKTVLQNHTWHGNFNALNDLLRGGFGTPEGGFTLVWKNSGKSRDDLGQNATVKHYEQLLKVCQPDNRVYLEEELERVCQGAGPTLFEIIVEIIHDHGPGGSEAEDGVLLQLE